MESNIKKNLRKPFLKELKPEEILKVKNLVSEKRLYLQLGKEVGPELATKLDNSKESDQPLQRLKSLSYNKLIHH